MWHSISEKEPHYGERILYITPTSYSIITKEDLGDPDASEVYIGSYVTNGKVEYDQDMALDEVAIWAEMPTGFTSAKKQFVKSKRKSK